MGDDALQSKGRSDLQLHKNVVPQKDTADKCRTLINKQHGANPVFHI